MRHHEHRHAPQAVGNVLGAPLAAANLADADHAIREHDVNPIRTVGDAPMLTGERHDEHARLKPFMNIVPDAGCERRRIRGYAGMAFLVGGNHPHAEAVLQRRVDGLADARIHRIAHGHAPHHVIEVGIFRYGEPIERDVISHDLDDLVAPAARHLQILQRIGDGDAQVFEHVARFVVVGAKHVALVVRVPVV